MENTTDISGDSPTMPPDYLPRNKIYAIIIIPLALILFFISGANILGVLLAPPQLIADEISPALRIFQYLVGLLGASAGLASGVIAWMSSINVGKFFAAGNYQAAAAASEKAQKNGKTLPLLIGLYGVWLVFLIVKALFLEK